MEMTPAHWVYLAGLASLIIVMVARKNVVVPAIAATFLTAVTFTGSVPGGLASVFRASLVAASELFNIFLIIALVTAMLAALRAIGAEHRMVAPFRRLMVNGPVAYIVLFVVTYAFALFFWPTPTLALIAAILLPAAIRAGLSPMAGAIAIAIAGQGMALASDYVIGVAPALSASGANVSADLIADRALILSWVVGIVALAMSYLMTVRRHRPSLAAGEPSPETPASVAPRAELAPAGVAAGIGSGGTSEQLGHALATKLPPREALEDGERQRLPPWSTTIGPTSAPRPGGPSCSPSWYPSPSVRCSSTCCSAGSPTWCRLTTAPGPRWSGAWRRCCSSPSR